MRSNFLTMAQARKITLNICFMILLLSSNTSLIHIRNILTNIYSNGRVFCQLFNDYLHVDSMALS